MTHPKAVLWDMDGTLIDSEHVAVDALRAALQDAGIPPIPDLHDQVVGRSADELYRWFVRDHGLALDPVSWERRKHHHHFAAAARITAFPQAIDVFRQLEALGIPQVIVTNSDRLIVDAQLRLAGLARPGLLTVARNDVRCGKPAPEGYLRAAWLLQRAPSDCIVAEDSPSGVAAGLAAGMEVRIVPHAPAAVTGAPRLSTMQDLVRLVGAA
jgi:HAD superfamily hydrolase (TIGR01509 family)